MRHSSVLFTRVSEEGLEGTQADLPGRACRKRGRSGGKEIMTNAARSKATHKKMDEAQASI